MSQRATGQSQRIQLYRATLLHTRATKLREKIAGVTSVLETYREQRNEYTLEKFV